MSKKQKLYGAFGRALGYGAAAMQGSSFSYNPTTYNNTYKYAGGSSSGGVKFSRERHRVGRRKRRQRARLSDVLNGKAVFRQRWQATSNTLIGPGKIPISYGFDSGSSGDIETLPIHMMSITNCGIGLASAEKGCHLPGMFRVCRDKNTGAIGMRKFDSQTYVGVNDWDSTGSWQGESNVTAIPANGDSLFHKWTEIRFNLYGAKYIPLTYTIKLVQVPQEYDIGKAEVWAPGAALPLGEFDQVTRWFEDVSRSLIANPINVTGTEKEYKSKVKVLKSYSVTIAPLSYTNAASEGTAPVHVGNVRQFKAFIRHDRFRKYDWAENAVNILPDRNLADLGFDVKTLDRMYCDVKWGQKVYLMLTCTTGPKVDSDAYDVYATRPYEYASIPNYEGTYDVLVRNEFLITK